MKKFKDIFKNILIILVLCGGIFISNTNNVYAHERFENTYSEIITCNVKDIVYQSDIDFNTLINELKQGTGIVSNLYWVSDSVRADIYYKLSDEELCKLFYYIKYDFLNQVNVISNLSYSEYDVSGLVVCYEPYAEVLKSYRLNNLDESTIKDTKSYVLKDLTTYSNEEEYIDYLSNISNIDIAELNNKLNSLCKVYGYDLFVMAETFKNNIYMAFGLEDLVKEVYIDPYGIMLTDVGSVTSYTQITSGISTGDFRVDGVRAYCAEYKKKTPPAGTGITQKVACDNANLRKALYYGYGGPGDVTASYSSDANRRHVITAVAVSWAYSGDPGVNNTYENFWNDLGNYSDPAGYTAYIAVTASTEVQDLAYGVADGISVVYKGNGGTWNNTDTWSNTATQGSTYTIEPNFYDRPGYTFIGWSTNPNADDGYGWTGWSGTWSYGNGSYGISGNTLTLYARWQFTGYRIVYKGNGGTWNGTDTWENAVSPGGYYIVEPNFFTNPNWTFLGWSTNPNADDGYGWTGWSGYWNYSNGQYGISNNTLTLYARWQYNGYIISYQGNGGTWNNQTWWNAYVMPGDSYTVESNFYTRTGYNFVSWSSNSSTDDGYGWTGWSGIWKDYGNQYGINNKVLYLYALWSPKTYTVTYNGNGGTYNGATTMSNNPRYNMDYYIYTNSFVRPGYTFVGWSEYPDKTDSRWQGFDGQIWKWTYDRNVTLYAIWEPNTYTVTYDGNGGTWNGTTSWSNTATYGSEYEIEENFFTRTGYTFIGWSRYPDKTDSSWQGWDGKTWTWGYAEDTTVYAIWEPNTYTVTYNGNGGTYGDGKTTWSNTATYDTDYHIEENFFEKTGYNFVGWSKYIDQTDSNWQGWDGQDWRWTRDSDVTLYAIWEPETYTVTYNGNGGTWKGQTYWSNTATYDAEYYIEENFFTRTGYTFLGWSRYPDKVDSSWQGWDGEIWVWEYTEDTTLYALWTPISVSVTYDGAGGTYDGGSTYINTATYDVKYIVEENKFIYDGYDFVGWIDQYGNNWTDKIGTEFTWNLTEDIILYAQWEINYMYIYLDGVNGNDSNNGLTPDSSVKTFKQAYTNLNGKSGTIFIVNTVTIDKDMTLDGNYYEDSDGTISLNEAEVVMIQRYAQPTAWQSLDGYTKESNKRTLIINNEFELTLNNLTLDGHKEEVNQGNIRIISSGIQSYYCVLSCGSDAITYLYNTNILNNKAMYSVGAISNDGILYLNKSNISYNETDDDVGGIENYNILELNESIISYNYGEYCGGVFSTKNLVSTDSIIMYNKVSTRSTAVAGIEIKGVEAEFKFEGGSISNNYGTGVRCNSSNSFIINRADIGYNSGTGVVSQDDEISILNCIIHDNDMAIYALGMEVYNCSIYNNSNGIDTWGTDGVHTVIIDNCDIYNNSGNGIYTNLTYNLYVNNSIIYNNYTGIFANISHISNTDIYSNTGHGVNIGEKLYIYNNTICNLDNDIYLREGAYVELIEELTQDTVGIITPSDYTTGRLLVKANYTKSDGTPATSDDVYSKFQLTPKDTYYIGNGVNLTDFGVEETDLVVWQDPGAIYVDGVNGNDSNSGLSPDNAVKTLRQAYTNITDKYNTIYVVDTITTTTNMTLTSISYTDSSGTVTPAGTIVIKRYCQPTAYSSLSGFTHTTNDNVLIQISNGNTLILSDITLDGHYNDVTSEMTSDARFIANGFKECTKGDNYSLIRAGYWAADSEDILTDEKGSLYTNSGTVLQNNLGHWGGAVTVCDYYEMLDTIIRDNHATVHGGGIYVKGGKFVMNSGIITNNTVPYSGGGICSVEAGSTEDTGSTVIINGGTISNNKALNGGGYLISKFSKVTISNCTFMNNTSENHGGAMYFQYNNECSITNCEIVNNYANYFAGAIYADSDTAINISDSNISDNKALYSGGGTCGGDFNFYNTTICNNQALTNNGGGICTGNTLETEVKIHNCIISGNKAFGDGGGISTGGYTLIDNCEIFDNEAVVNGGAIRNFRTLDVIGYNIHDNIANTGSGIYNTEIINLKGNVTMSQENDIYLYGDTIINVVGELTNTEPNRITPSAYINGKTLVRNAYKTGTTPNASENYSKFVLTSIGSYVLRPGDYISDVIGILDTDTVISTEYSISYNRNIGQDVENLPETQYGYWNEVLTLSENIPTLKKYKFTNWNTNIDGSGISYNGGESFILTDNIILYAQWVDDQLYIYIDGVDGSDTNSGLNPEDSVKTFRQAYTNLEGESGRIYVVNTVTINEDMTLDGNYYEDNLGKIQLNTDEIVDIMRYSQPTAYLMLNGYDSESNKASLIRISNGELIISGKLKLDGHSDAITDGSDKIVATSIVSSNSIIFNESKLKIQDAIMVNNYIFEDVKYNGGAIENHCGEVVINYIDVHGCYSNYGGAIHVYDGKITINDCDIYNNESVMGGGALYIAYESELVLNGGNIYNNKAGYSAGVYVNQNSKFTFNDGNIINNVAHEYSGGIDIRISELEMNGGNVSDNRTLGGSLNGNVGAYGSGAGINLYESTATINNGNITNNISYTSGGGIYIGSSNCIINNCNINNNTAQTFGGGIRIGDQGSLILNDANIDSNMAENGGGIHNHGVLKLLGGTISNNKATDGAGIYNTSSGSIIMKKDE